MARGIIALFLVISCTSPVTNNTTTTSPVTVVTQSRTVMNSMWKDVTPTVSKYLARGAVNLDSSVADYNATHIDDQWFIVDGEVPDLDHAPPAQAYIVDPDTHAPLIDSSGNPYSYTDWPRKQLVENYTGWVHYAESSGGVLYIDVIPPAPIPPTAEQLYAKYSIYVIDSAGAILYEFHCDVVPDGFPGFTVKQYFSTMLTHANLIVQTDGNGLGWSVVSGQVYTAP